MKPENKCSALTWSRCKKLCENCFVILWIMGFFILIIFLIIGIKIDQNSPTYDCNFENAEQYLSCSPINQIISYNVSQFNATGNPCNTTCYLMCSNTMNFECMNFEHMNIQIHKPDYDFTAIIFIGVALYIVPFIAAGCFLIISFVCQKKSIKYTNNAQNNDMQIN